MERYERHTEACGRLNDELNFLDFVRIMRVFKFLSHLRLRNYQRILVQSFQRYQLKGCGKDDPLGDYHEQESSDEGDGVQRGLRAKALQDLIGKFNPSVSREDTALLYEITGYKDGDKQTKTGGEINPSINPEDKLGQNEQGVDIDIWGSEVQEDMIQEDIDDEEEDAQGDMRFV